jgi:hypothetical protein
MLNRILCYEKNQSMPGLLAPTCDKNNAGYPAAASALFELSQYLAGSACKQLSDANPSTPLSIFWNE